MIHYNEFKNNKMKALISSFQNESPEIKTTIPNGLKEILHPKISIVHDCLVIDPEGRLNDSSVSLDVITKFHFDRTGYEACQNETFLNHYIDEDNPDLSYLLELGFIVLDSWGQHLKSIFPDDTFCLLISCDENRITLRFHKMRSDESLWLSTDLDAYEEPVAYQII